MPRKSRSKYIHEQIKPMSAFDPRSIRTVTVKKGTLTRIGCPKGYWSVKTKRCKVGTEAQAILKRKKNPHEELPDIIYESGEAYQLYDAFPSLDIAREYARDYERSGLGKAIVRDSGPEAGRLRYFMYVTEHISKKRVKKNPDNQYFIYAKKGSKSGLFTGSLSLTDSILEALPFNKEHVAEKVAEKLRKNFPTWKWIVVDSESVAL